MFTGHYLGVRLSSRDCSINQTLALPHGYPRGVGEDRHVKRQLHFNVIHSRIHLGTQGCESTGERDYLLGEGKEVFKEVTFVLVHKGWFS